MVESVDQKGHACTDRSWPGGLKDKTVPLTVLVFKAHILDTVLFLLTQEGSLLYGELYNCEHNLYKYRLSSLDLEVGHIGRREGKRAQIENAMRGAGTVVTQPFRKMTTGGASWHFVVINFNGG